MAPPSLALPSPSDRRAVLLIAAWANCDPRTVRKFLAGRAVNSMSEYALESACRALGYVENDVAPTG